MTTNKKNYIESLFSFTSNINYIDLISSVITELLTVEKRIVKLISENQNDSIFPININKKLDAKIKRDLIYKTLDNSELIEQKVLAQLHSFFIINKTESDFNYIKFSEEKQEQILKSHLISQDLIIDLILKVYIDLYDNLFPDIIDYYKKTNKYFSKNEIELLKILIPKYENSLDVHSIMQYFDEIDFAGYSIVLSKKTSDRLSNDIRSILIQRLKMIGGTHSNNKMIDEDGRIITNLRKEEIELYFNQLWQKKISNNGATLLDEDTVKNFLHSNFYEFSPKQEKKLITIDKNITDGANIIKYFIYMFCKYKDNNNGKNRVKIYAQLLKNNFSHYAEINEKTILTHFSRVPKNYPF